MTIRMRRISMRMDEERETVLDNSRRPFRKVRSRLSRLDRHRTSRFPYTTGCRRWRKCRSSLLQVKGGRERNHYFNSSLALYYYFVGARRVECHDPFYAICIHVRVYTFSQIQSQSIFNFRLCFSRARSVDLNDNTKTTHLQPYRATGNVHNRGIKSGCNNFTQSSTKSRRRESLN